MGLPTSRTENWFYGADEQSFWVWAENKMLSLATKQFVTAASHLLKALIIVLSITNCKPILVFVVVVIVEMLASLHYCTKENGCLKDTSKIDL